MEQTIGEACVDGKKKKKKELHCGHTKLIDTYGILLSDIISNSSIFILTSFIKDLLGVS